MRRRFDVMSSMPEGDRRRLDRDRRSPEGDRRERPRRPRGPLPRRSQLLVGLLCATLGFALAVQVHTTRSTPSLATVRPEDLVSILDDLTARGDRLRAEADSLTATRDRLTAGGQESTAAVDEARQRADALGILAGTVPATGPGIVLTITAVSYTHLRAHETPEHLVCRLLLEKKKKKTSQQLNKNNEQDINKKKKDNKAKN